MKVGYTQTNALCANEEWKQLGTKKQVKLINDNETKEVKRLPK